MTLRIMHLMGTCSIIDPDYAGLILGRTPTCCRTHRGPPKFSGGHDCQPRRRRSGEGADKAQVQKRLG